jgi:hypothetical protein
MSSSEELDFLNRPNCNYDADAFFYFLRNWAKKSVDSTKMDLNDILPQIEIVSVLFNKVLTSPEHESVVIETMDHMDKKTRLFVLERTITSSDFEIATNSDSNARRERLINKIRQRASAAYSKLTIRPSDLGSLEEGLGSGPYAKKLSVPDMISISFAQTVDLISESFDKDAVAKDQFLGEHFVDYSAENMRFFKPKKTLTLFDFALLAKTVHSMYPTYTLLGEQCFFYSGIIYFAALSYSGSVDSSPGPNHNGFVQIDSSRLSNRYGSYKGVHVGDIDQRQIQTVLDKFRNLRVGEMKVTL